MTDHAHPTDTEHENLHGPHGHLHLHFHPRATVRVITSIVLAGILGAIIFLTVAQEAYKKGFTDHRFNGSMGILLEGTNEQVARRGLYGTLLVGVLMALAYWPIGRRLVRSPIIKGIGIGIVGFLGWALVFGPAAGGHSTVPAGLFGLEADPAAPVVIFIAAMAGGITMARVFDVVIDTQWWVPRQVNYEETVEALLASQHVTIDERQVGETAKRAGGKAN